MFVSSFILNYIFFEIYLSINVYYFYVPLRILQIEPWLVWLSRLSAMPAVPACELKGHWFDSQSGHMLGLSARSPVGDV